MRLVGARAFEDNNRRPSAFDDNHSVPALGSLANVTDVSSATSAVGRVEALLRLSMQAAKKHQGGIDVLNNATAEIVAATEQLAAVLRKVSDPGSSGMASPLLPLESNANAAEVAGEAIDDRQASANTLSSDNAGFGIQVDLAACVERVFDVNTIEQCFSCQIKVSMHWLCPSHEEPPDPHMDDGDWVPNWTPKLRVKQILEEILPRSDHYMIVFKDGQKFVKGDIRFLVRIANPLNLMSFPTDCQDLTIMLVSKMASDQVVWNLKDVIVSRDRFNLNDFRLVDEMPYTHHVELFKEDDDCYSLLMVSVKIVRKSMYYHLNISLVMFLIITSVFCAWGLHPGDIEARQGVDFNLILTAVAFSVVKTAMLPKVSYVTYIDIYIYICWAFLLSATVLHCALPYRHFTRKEMSAITRAPLEFDDSREQDFIAEDQLVCYVMAGVWLLVNLIFFATLKRWAKKDYRQFIEQAKANQKLYTATSGLGGRTSSRGGHY